VESLKAFEDLLIPMTTLSGKVSDFADLCLPDTLYTTHNPSTLSFTSVNLGEILGDPDQPDTVGLLTFDGEPQTHIMTKWSRSQLLSIVGTKEKWFHAVTRRQEAEELNLRLSSLYDHRVRTMRTHFGDLRVVRGIVSKFYGDIPDTEVMKVMLELMPEGYAVRGLSDKTDRAFYVYALADTMIGIPGTRFHGFPGVVVKNSEVGYTSLWVVPTLFLPGYRKAIVFEKQVLLRRIHRGSYESMKAEFEEAMQKAAAVWSDIAKSTVALAQIVFPDADTAISRMKTLIAECGGTKQMAHNCELKYQAHGHVLHTGQTIFSAILEVTEGLDADEAYTESVVAGAVLWRLTT
jgi:hypothetical protein